MLEQKYTKELVDAYAASKVVSIDLREVSTQAAGASSFQQWFYFILHNQLVKHLGLGRRLKSPVSGLGSAAEIIRRFQELLKKKYPGQPPSIFLHLDEARLVSFVYSC